MKVEKSYTVEMASSILERAKLHWRRTEDSEAEQLLLDLRHEATINNDSNMVACTEISMAEMAYATDEDEQSETHLERARLELHEIDDTWKIRHWLTEIRLGRRKGVAVEPNHILHLEELMKLDCPKSIAGDLLIEHAIIDRLSGNLESSTQYINSALELLDDGTYDYSAALLERAEQAITASDWQAANKDFSRAFEILQTENATRELGRSIARFAVAVSPKLEESEIQTPAAWLGKAQALLAPSASWRDLSAARVGFRVHGRRIQDQALEDKVAGQIEQLEHTSSRLRGLITKSIDEIALRIGAAQKLLDNPPNNVTVCLDEARGSLHGMLETATGQSKDLIKQCVQLEEVIESAVVEKNRMRDLLNVLEEIDSFTDVKTLGETAARAGARLLNSDLVVLARKLENGQIEPIGLHHIQADSTTSDRWKAPLESYLEQPERAPDKTKPSSRSEATPRGPVLVALKHSKDMKGVLYADKLDRSGRFNELDYQLGQFLLDYCTMAYSRLKAIVSQRTTAEQLTTIVNTIRDGVISVDVKGVVTNMNRAAATILRVDSERIMGQSLASAPELAPLVQILISTLKVDNALVKLKHGSFFVTARPIQSDSKHRGVVATLVGMERAQRIAQRVTAARPRYTFDDILGTSPELLEAIRMSRQAATVDANVLITGGSGTGKEVLAQAIHTGGQRANELFVGVNCAAVPRELLEAELFGYEKGAFTGARTDGNQGKFELAGNGMILLDEIGDMPLDMQAKLLRVLQERIVVRLGGSVERRVDARVVATTHRDLDALVKAGKFRHDLLYRLRVLSIHLPSLADRGSDVLILALAFLKRFAKQQNKAVREISPSVQLALETYSWPGNVRELANVMEREVSLLDGDAQVMSSLQSPLVASQSSSTPSDLGDLHFDRGSNTILPLAEVERRAYLRALELSSGNVPKAAKALGVSKVTFYTKLRSWGMHPKDKK